MKLSETTKYRIARTGKFLIACLASWVFQKVFDHLHQSRSLKALGSNVVTFLTIRIEMPLFPLLIAFATLFYFAFYKIKFTYVYQGEF
jgi:hypothetical protein